MTNQNLTLNACAFYAGFKALQSSFKVFIGSDSIKERSKTWSSVSTQKGYVQAFGKTAQVIFGKDSFSSRITNLVQGFFFTSATYLLADLSREVSHTKEFSGQANHQLACLKNDQAAAADVYIENAHKLNLQANTQELLANVVSAVAGFTSCQSSLDASKTNLGLCENNLQSISKLLREEKDTNNALQEQAKCTDQNEQITTLQQKLRDEEDKNKVLQEQAKCENQENRLKDLENKNKDLEAELKGAKGSITALESINARFQEEIKKQNQPTDNGNK